MDLSKLVDNVTPSNKSQPAYTAQDFYDNYRQAVQLLGHMVREANQTKQPIPPTSGIRAGASGLWELDLGTILLETPNPDEQIERARIMGVACPEYRFYDAAIELLDPAGNYSPATKSLMVKKKENEIGFIMPEGVFLCANRIPGYRIISYSLDPHPLIPLGGPKE